MVISWHWSQYWVLTFLSQLMGPNLSSSSLSVMVGLPTARPNTDNINNNSAAFIVHSCGGTGQRWEGWRSNERVREREMKDFLISRQTKK